MRRLGATAVLAAVLACGGADDTIRGLIVDIEGDLQHGISSFVVRSDDGGVLTLVPDKGLTFDGAPLTHLSAHLAAGDPVIVEYVEEADGVLIATRLTDG